MEIEYDVTVNTSYDDRYEGPLLKKLPVTPAPVGKLIAWNPVEQREVWEVTHPVLESGGVLATAGNPVFQGRSDGALCAYRATDGQKLWEYNAGTGIMAPPVTYLENGVQYLTVMAGWGGSAGLINAPGAGLDQARLWASPDVCDWRKRKTGTSRLSGTTGPRHRRSR